MPRKILIIDDDEDIRSSIAEALTWEGVETLSATHGLEALSLLERIPVADLPCLIILDLQMPVMDGLTFVRAIEGMANMVFATIPIVIATAKGISIDLENYPLIKQVVKKPLELEELYRLVQDYCTDDKA